MKMQTDRRVQRTRELLRNSLFALVAERGYDALSVQDIIDRANVGRATFYAHFNNKDELLLCGFDVLHQELKQLQHQAAGSSDPETRLFAFSRHIFAHVEKYRPVYHAMARDRGGVAVRQRLHRLLVDCSKVELKRLHGRSGRELDALTQFFSGAFVGLLSWWMEASAPMGVEKVDQLFRRLAIPALAAAADGPVDRD